MKVYEITQGTPQWHQWRSQRIGASEAGSILNLNPYRSCQSVWEEKVLGWEVPATQKMLDGQKNEILAREAYQELTKTLVKPLVAECEKISYIAASFDGVSECRKKIVEIKCGKMSHKLARSGLIPPYYFAQCSHQLYVSDLDEMDYFSWYDGEGIIIPVKRDENFIIEMMKKYEKFWKCITTGVWNEII